MDKVLAAIFLTLAATAIANCQQNPSCLLARLISDNAQACYSQLLANPITACTMPCVRTLSADHEECGYTGINNPVTTACGALPTPDGSGNSTSTGPLPGISGNPTCLLSSLQQSQSLQLCATQLLLNGAQGLCDSPCLSEIERTYDSCGYSGSFNPATICNISRNGTTHFNGVDISCLSNELQALTGLQYCSSQLASNPAGACSSTCATQLKVAYSNCGFRGDSNPVETLCRFENFTVTGVSTVNTICLSTRLQSPELQLCLTDLAFNPSGVCSSKCVQSLTSAYNDCGFLGVNNPADLVCGYVRNSTAGLTSPLQRCITNMQQGMQRCVANLIITRNFDLRDCARDIQEAFSVCGFDQRIYNFTGIVCNQETNPPTGSPVVPTPSRSHTSGVPSRSSSRVEDDPNNGDKSSGQSNGSVSVTTAMSMTIITVATLIFSILV